MTQPDSERSIERLIKLAGERDMPTPEGMERARLAAHEAWTRMLGQRRRPRRAVMAQTGAGVRHRGGHRRGRAVHRGPAPMRAAPELVARIVDAHGRRAV